MERNLNLETAANNKAPVGKYTVTVSFAIDSSGNVIEAKILKDPGYGTSQDVIHMLNKSPKWLPASINGIPCLYRQKQNITYQVEEE